MAWATARQKTYVSGAAFSPSDANAIQDQYVRPTGITQDDLDAATLAVPLGLTQTAVSTGGAAVRRGAAIIPSEQTITGGGIQLMPTPDRVQNVVLPTNGLIVVYYQAQWKSSDITTPIAWLYMGENKVKTNMSGDGSSVSIYAQLDTNSQKWQVLGTDRVSGLVTTNSAGDVTADATTGQVLGAGSFGGSSAVIFADAGIYDVSIRYETLGPTVCSAKARRLYVETIL